MRGMRQADHLKVFFIRPVRLPNETPCLIEAKGGKATMCRLCVKRWRIVHMASDPIESMKRTPNSTPTERTYWAAATRYSRAAHLMRSQG